MTSFESRSGDGLIFFDTKNDEYSCSYDPERPIPDYSSTDPYTAFNTNELREPAQSPWSELKTPDHLFVTASVVMQFLIALVKSSFQFRGRSVHELTTISGKPGRRRYRTDMTVQQASYLFKELLFFLPFRPECLFSSFFLLNFLDRYGLGADWTFGVHLFPFRAHCWLAYGSELLNETPHAIEDYQVIYIARRVDR